MPKTVLVSPAQRMAAEALVEWYEATGRPVADSLRQIATPEKLPEPTTNVERLATGSLASSTATNPVADVGAARPRGRAVTLHVDASVLSVLVSLLELLDSGTGRSSAARGRARRLRAERRAGAGHEAGTTQVPMPQTARSR